MFDALAADVMPVKRERTRSRVRAACEHTRHVTTVFAGISRTVCTACGRVSVAHDRDLVVDGSPRLDVPHVTLGKG